MSADSLSLRQSLLAALAYFDLFEYPLTLMELLRFRFGGSADATASAVLEALDGASVGAKDGYWFLAGRESTVETRRRRFRLAGEKYVRARTVVRWLRLLPSVRMVAVCNSLALANADTESDIDLFVVVRPGALWITRLLAVGALAVLGLRPTGESHADKVCMSFFVSEDAMDLSRLSIGPEDTYLRYWIATLVPLHDAGGIFASFLAANAWAADLLPGAPAAPLRAPRPVVRSAGFLLPLLRRLDGPAKRLQLRMFPAEIAAAANLDSRVVVSDDILKFHVTDRRAYFERQFRERLRDISLAEVERSKGFEVKRPLSASSYDLSTS